MEYICDDKYQNIIEELDRRQWKLLPSTDSAVPRECALMWKNLSKTKFPAVLGRYVNHIKGIHHLSNKSYLVYHLSGGSVLARRLLPPSWSSSCHSLGDLIGLLTADQLLSVAANVLQVGGSCAPHHPPLPPPAALPSQQHQQLKECAALLQLLRIERESESGEAWSDTVLARACEALLQSLERMTLGSAVASQEKSIAECHTHLAYAQQCFTGWEGRGLGGEQLQGGGGEEGLGNERLWIVKPVALSCGEGISVQRGARAVMRAAAALGYKCVVQKYIERPLLLRCEQKFDIRQWALVTCLNPLVMFGFSECYLRLSSQPYSTHEAGLGQSLVHLCNQSIQGRDESQVEGRKVSVGGAEHQHECETMMTQQEFDTFLRQIDTAQYAERHPGRFAGIVSSGRPFTFDEVILPQIREACVEAVRAARDRLQRVGKGFEWLGFDLMVTRALEVRLIEVNVSPDVTASTSITGRLVRAATSDLFTLLLDEGAVEEQAVVSRHKSAPAVHPHRLDNESNTPGPQWSLWHSGLHEAPSRTKDFAASKLEERGVLRVGDNSAATCGLLEERVLTVLAGRESAETGGDNGNGDIGTEEDEEDEI
mmetsp:Transcript_20122/g.33903  ORF Transcript_20122/g.33903 Transcript_20122/m.33903 type:complete len:597 (-) Transcript_20122:243-2033(-)